MVKEGDIVEVENPRGYLILVRIIKVYKNGRVRFKWIFNQYNPNVVGTSQFGGKAEDYIPSKKYNSPLYKVLNS